MQGHCRRRKSVVAASLIAGICLLSGPTAAQQPGPPSKQPTVSDDDLIKLHQQITELKNPTFRAFLRMRLISWKLTEPGRMRQPAMDVALQGVRDLCQHQDEVWTPTASWLHRSLVEQINKLQSPDREKTRSRNQTFRIAPVSFMRDCQRMKITGRLGSSGRPLSG